MSYLEFRNVTKNYHVGEVDIHALAGIDFQVEKGQLVIICGASGAGKSTILNIIIIEGKSYCQDCKQTYKTTKYGRTCPYCGSSHTYLVTGRDVVIRDIQAV